MKKRLAGILAALMVFTVGTTVLAANSPTTEKVTVQQWASAVTEATMENGNMVKVEPVSSVNIVTEANNEAKRRYSNVQDVEEVIMVAVVDLTAVMPVNGAAVSIKVKGVYEGNDVRLLHREANGSWISILPSNVNRGEVIATFTSLSPIAVVRLLKEGESLDPPEDSQTPPDDTQTPPDTQDTQTPPDTQDTQTPPDTQDTQTPSDTQTNNNTTNNTTTNNTESNTNITNTTETNVTTSTTITNTTETNKTTTSDITNNTTSNTTSITSDITNNTVVTNDINRTNINDYNENIVNRNIYNESVINKFGLNEALTNIAGEIGIILGVPDIKVPQGSVPPQNSNLPQGSIPPQNNNLPQGSIPPQNNNLPQGVVPPKGDIPGQGDTSVVNNNISISNTNANTNTNTSNGVNTSADTGKSAVVNTSTNTDGKKSDKTGEYPSALPLLAGVCVAGMIICFKKLRA